MEQAVPPRKPTTLDDYFALERTSQLRHEYHGPGRIVAMSGGSFTHGQIATNISRELSNRLLDGPCQALTSDTRVTVKRLGRYFYPDATALCGTPDIERKDGIDSLTNPQVIVEVLSPSSERDDRRVKCDAYMQIESLREYVLIEQDEARITILSRADAGGWAFERVVGLDQTLTLRSLDLAIPLSAIYRNVTFPPPPEQAAVPSTPQA